MLHSWYIYHILSSVLPEITMIKPKVHFWPLSSLAVTTKSPTLLWGAEIRLEASQTPVLSLWPADDGNPPWPQNRNQIKPCWPTLFSTGSTFLSQHVQGSGLVRQRNKHLHLDSTVHSTEKVLYGHSNLPWVWRGKNCTLGIVSWCFEQLILKLCIGNPGCNPKSCQNSLPLLDL